LKLHVLNLPVRSDNVFADDEESFEVGARDNINGFGITNNNELSYLHSDTVLWIHF